MLEIVDEGVGVLWFIGVVFVFVGNEFVGLRGGGCRSE